MNYLLILILIAGHQASSRLVEATKATIGEKVITRSEVVLFQKQLKVGLIPDSILFKVFSKKQMIYKQKTALDFMVTQETLFKESEAKEIPELESQIQKTIRSIKKRSSDKTFAKKLSIYGLNLKSLRKMVEKSVKNDFLISESVLPKTSVTEADIDSYYFNKYKKKLFRHFQYEFSAVVFSNNKLGKQKAKTFLTKLETLPFKLASKEMGLNLKVSTLKDVEINKNMKQALEGLFVSQVSKPLLLGADLFILKLNWKQAYLLPSEEKTKKKIQTNLLDSNLKRELKQWIKKQKTRFLVQIHSS